MYKTKPSRAQWRSRWIALLMAAIGAGAAATETAPAPTALPYWRASLLNNGWTKKDGAPAGLFSMAQDSSGMLWFAASDGLRRFDGARFERVDQIDGNALQSSNILSVATFGDALWVGYQFGGISVFEHGQARHYTARDGAPGGSIFHIDRMPNGIMWVSSARGMYWLDGGRWHLAGAAQGLPEGATSAFDILADGSLQVYFPDGIYRSAPNAPRFHRALAEPGIEGGEPLPDGRFLINSQRHGMQLYAPDSGQLEPFKLHNGGAPMLGYYSDRRGGLWVSAGEGIELLDLSGRPMKTYTPAQGFTGKGFMANLRDREGNLWFVTENGIDRVRPTRLTTVALPTGVTEAFSVVAGDGGAVWISNMYNQGAFKVPTFGLAPDGARQFSVARNVSCSYRDSEGGVWFANATTLWRQYGGQLRQWQRPPELVGKDMQAMARDRDGTLWLSVVGAGIYTFRDGRWLAGDGRPELRKPTAISLMSDARGRVWFGYVHNHVAMLDHGKLRQFDASSGLAIGNTLAMAMRGGRLWLGGEGGLAYLDGERFVTLADSEHGAFRGVSGIVATAAGELWLHGVDGLARIGAADLDAALRGKAASVRSETFDYLDGYQGTPAMLRPLPTLVQATDGRLWYATSSGIGWIDPAHIARNPLAPTAQVTAIKTDQQSYRPGAGLRLPQRTHNLEIDFTAAALAMPERVRFRYRLTGQDTQWRDAGNRRQAFYTNLEPGDYTFEVMAANEDGVWSRHAGAARFRIEPAFTQTLWFKLACGAAALAAVYLLYLARLAKVTAGISERMRVRVLERERIARTLHDTFLQSVQALILRVHTMLGALPDDGTRQKMESVLLYAEDVMNEGRDRVMDLRVTTWYHGDLLRALGDAGRELSMQHAAAFTLHSEGPVRALLPEVMDEVFSVGREALFNAFRHAHSASVELELHYAAAEFALIVRDHGQGVDAEILSAGGKPGHWGLAGMRERAKRLGGTLTINSVAGTGTEVCLRIGARQAYGGPAWSRIGRLFRPASA